MPCARGGNDDLGRGLHTRPVRARAQGLRGHPAGLPRAARLPVRRHHDSLCDAAACRVVAPWCRLGGDAMIPVVLMTILLLILLVSGAPIFVAVGGAALAGLFAAGQPLDTAASVFISTAGNFALIA